MKKFLRITVKTLAAIVSVLVLVLITTSITNVVANTVEGGRVKTYGHLVPVDGKKMNVSISGSGEETVVLLPGFGTSSPVLDFAPLVAELQETYKVIVVEPFGYGVSDLTDKERTSANIADELHEALHYLGVDRYALMGHSISGIYALNYVNAYRDEVIAKYQMRILTNRNSLSDTYVNEMVNIASNFKNAQTMAFPADLPLLMFVQADNVDWWIPLHEEQVAGVGRGELVALDADHYLHHTKSKEISETFTRFMSEVTPTP